MANTIRTRFAPSPTGHMHIGNLRTALYEYLIAKSQGGSFILRIEDTDRQRLVEGAESVVYNSLKLAGLAHDEGPDVGGAYGPYVQSERRDLYLPRATELVERGFAYYCFCDKDRLASLKESSSDPWGGSYDGHCRNIPPQEALMRVKAGEPYTIRQKAPHDDGSTSFVDAVFGEVTINNRELEDQILIKSDGLPTYNFANVIDDHLMEITHVVRGAEYITSTPKYVLLYEAFGWKQPVFIHLPSVTKEGGKKMSKREGDPSFEDYIASGYLPEALINYIALLGWSPGGTREFYTLAELAELFSIKGISKSPATFDIQKLRYFNAEYIRKLSPERFIGLAAPYIRRAVKSKEYKIPLIAKLLQPRVETLNEISDADALAFFDKIPDYPLDLYVNKKMKTDADVSAIAVKSARENLSTVPENEWTQDGIRNAIIGAVEERGLKNGQVMWPVRIALTGMKTTPGGAVEIAEILGKSETVKRLDLALARLTADSSAEDDSFTEGAADIRRSAITPELSEKLSNRPVFPERAIITGGMPYGNKGLHFGHIGGYFIHADAFARFLRDRIGKDNVLFVSGTDCYGSPIAEDYRKRSEAGLIDGGVELFAQKNHEDQKDTLDKYDVSLDIYAASAFGRASIIHKELSKNILRKLRANGHLEKLSTEQFFDAERGVFLNGRQVIGKCPVAGCQSEKGYADECDLGHQYSPTDLIDPKSSLSGKRPEMRKVTNWYVKTETFRGLLHEWLKELSSRPCTRPFVSKTIGEFLEPPAIYLKRELLDEARLLDTKPRDIIDDGKSTSVKLVYASLTDRERACSLLSDAGMNFRTGKTLPPFRLTGNIDWGVPAPEMDELSGLTIWVWPESLWAPISFTQAALEERAVRDGGTVSADAWKTWWTSRKTRVFQFIGQDNVYFYGPAQASLFMGLQGSRPSSAPADGELPMTDLIVSNHILFMNRKASSSGAFKPPMAKDLLAYYTAEQLRAHFLGLGLGIRSVSFQPKPLDPDAAPSDADPVLKEGNMLTNVLNRIARSCFYTAQKYTDGQIPDVRISDWALRAAAEAALDYERLMMKCEFHQIMSLLDVFVRQINKSWSKNMKDADANGDDSQRRQTLADSFHMLRVAAVLTRPVAPRGANEIAKYFGIREEDFFNWKNIFRTPDYFAGSASQTDSASQNSLKLKFLEPRKDFFSRHDSQIQKSEAE